jgi:RNA-binding protein YlmH
MTKVLKFSESDLLTQKIKSAVDTSLMEAGLKSDMISTSKAYQLLPRSYVDKGIRDGKIKTTGKSVRNSKILVKVADIIAYREFLLNEGTIKIKSKS